MFWFRERERGEEDEEKERKNLFWSSKRMPLGNKKIIIINKRKRQAILQGTERDSTTPSLSFSFLPGGR